MSLPHVVSPTKWNSWHSLETMVPAVPGLVLHIWQQSNCWQFDSSHFALRQNQLPWASASTMSLSESPMEISILDRLRSRLFWLLFPDEWNDHHKWDNCQDKSRSANVSCFAGLKASLEKSFFQKTFENSQKLLWWSLFLAKGQIYNW